MMTEKEENKSKMEKLKNSISPDLYMLPAKVSYFFTSGQDGSFRPYMMPFFVGIGLNKAEAGFVIGNLVFLINLHFTSVDRSIFWSHLLKEECHPV